MSWLTLKDGERLFYQDIGSGRKTVVMLHGWASSHEIYSRPVELMKEKARFIIYDLRGHGESKDACKEQVGIETLASDLNELITTLELQDINLFGWSMGGAVALKYIDMYGCDKIKQTIICDMSPKQLNDAEWKLGSKVEDSIIKETGGYEKCDFYTIYKDFSLKSMPELVEVPGKVLDRLIRMRLDECNETVLRSLIKSLDAQDNREVFKKMNVPLVYFYANPGSIFSPKLVNWYRDNSVNEFRAEEFKGNHMFIMDNPDVFAQKLVNVLL
ncbi:hydrolase alpha/beta fold family [Butyrivibrio proteoclasticus B316]|uniref:Hydrolase alpha/beta fold family n=1 Tax=Butyrivibrio proteoclasticus (strain ATCC 51982 / DSM 14932 / B316) TaxID=515622 RepID=E0RXH0_BUTPB|nr:alpha/beta hydrolase [Butyrivibrio proteoclasticus]ADL33008.1 hydrolase alpha/beta fold family [Butyrivibrio proteoclasticus B316]